MGNPLSVSLPSSNQHNFAQIPRADIQRSSFNRTSTHKTTFDSGYLIPFFVDEVLPADTFNLDATLMARLATPLTPFMDNMYLDSFYFFVPLRILQTNFQKLMGEQDNPGDSISFLTPIVPAPTTTGFAVQSIYDYFGIRTAIDDFSVCNYWGRGYNLIFNEWFRDQNLQNSSVVDVDDGPDVATDYPLLRRGKRHDYFTSCLPFPQKGPSVPLPLTGNAPVLGIGAGDQAYAGSGTFYEADLTTTAYPFAKSMWDAGAGNQVFLRGTAATGGYPNVYADLSQVTATTINSLRQAFQLQRLYERDARGGTRYREILLAHFGVSSPDARMMVPEFLGGSSQRIHVNAVQGTSYLDDSAGGILGMLGGNVSVISRNGFTKSFVEHGVIIGLMSVRADLTYQQGTHRMFFRRTKHDFYWPALAHLGEQAVLNQEIFTQGTADDILVWGYQERWAEYRFKPSIITGKFRSDFATPLDFWHLSQDFASLPTLSSTFIVDNPPVARVLAVQDVTIFGAQFIFDSHIKCKTVRAMPTYSVPGLIDHF